MSNFPANPLQSRALVAQEARDRVAGRVPTVVPLPKPKPRERIDPMSLVIAKGVPVPEDFVRPGAWEKLVAPMQADDMVRAPNMSAGKSIERALRKRGMSVTTRRLPDGEVGVWCLGPVKAA